MMIEEVIKRECCNLEKDLKRVSIPNYHNCSFCIHCGQWYLNPEKEDPTGFTIPDRTFRKLYPTV